MSFKYLIVFLLGIATLTAPTTEADAGESLEYKLEIKDHKFVTPELKVPAGKKIKLTVYNLDPTAEEFESHDLKREKVIAPNSKAVMLVGPLKPGTYKYFGEFNQDTAQGVIIAE